MNRLPGRCGTCPYSREVGAGVLSCSVCGDGEPRYANTECRRSWNVGELVRTLEPTLRLLMRMKGGDNALRDMLDDLGFLGWVYVEAEESIDAEFEEEEFSDGYETVPLMGFGCCPDLPMQEPMSDYYSGKLCSLTVHAAKPKEWKVGDCWRFPGEEDPPEWTVITRIEGEQIFSRGPAGEQYRHFLDEFGDAVKCDPPKHSGWKGGPEGDPRIVQGCKVLVCECEKRKHYAITEGALLRVAPPPTWVDSDDAWRETGTVRLEVGGWHEKFLQYVEWTTKDLIYICGPEEGGGK